MTWSPWGVKVLATCSGGRTFEKELHRLFRKDRVRSEWFRGSPALHELIDWCKKHPNADVAAIRAAAEKALGVTEMRTNMSRKARAKRSKSRLAAKIKSGEITIKQLPKEPND